jgi:hypothetical protein
MPSLYAVLADVTLVTHALFVAVVIGGQAAILIGWSSGWTWTRAPIVRAAHAAVVVKAWLGIPCALTVLENVLRGRGSLPADLHRVLARPAAVLLSAAVGVHRGVFALRPRGARHVDRLSAHAIPSLAAS